MSIGQREKRLERKTHETGKIGQLNTEEVEADQLISDQHHIYRTQQDDGELDRPVMAVEANNNRTDRDDDKFPDPEFLPYQGNYGVHDGIQFPSAMLQDFQCEKRIQTVQSPQQDQEKQHAGIIAVHISFSG
jgi:hypothetical protein